MKKLLAILLCVLMISSILVVNAAAEDKVEITYSYWGTPKKLLPYRLLPTSSTQNRIGSMSLSWQFQMKSTQPH